MAKNKRGGVGSWLTRLRNATRVVKTLTPMDPELYRGLELNETGVSVNASNAMQLDTVWSCVRLIAETIATLPLHLMVQDEMKPKRASRHPVYSLLLASPNSESTASLFWEAVVSAMLLQGNAYVEVRRYDGKISSLMFLAPAKLAVVRDLNGNKRFFYTENGKQREIARAKVWQLQGYSLDGQDGCSVIEYANKVFGTAIAAERSAARTFWNGMMQAVYYTVQSFLTDEQRDAFRKHVAGTVERGQAPILEGGTDVKSIQIKPSDAQLLETRSYSVEQICRWFRVPPPMVGHNQKSTSFGTGMETQVLGFLQFTLMPWITRIEQAVNLGLLSPAERTRYHAKFDTKQLLRADSATRAQVIDTYIKGGVMTPDEGRMEEGLPTMGGNASKLFVQGAMVLLDAVGQNNLEYTSKGNAEVGQPGTEEALLAALQRFTQAASTTNGGNKT